MELSPKEIEHITEFLHIEAEPDLADVAILFGGRFLDPAHIAADLFHRKMVKRVVVTGGLNPYTQAIEAHVHRDILVERDVPEKWIVVEDTSTNTLENVLFLIPKLSAEVDLNSIRSIVVVTKWYHCRRAMMTLRAYMPQGIRYYARTYEPEETTQGNWFTSEQGRKRVLKEWQAIPKYLKKGDIAEIQKVAGACV